MPAFFYSIDKVYTTVYSIFIDHVPKVGILFTSIVFIHVQNTVNISDSFIKEVFLCFVNDVITFVSL